MDEPVATTEVASRTDAPTRGRRKRVRHARNVAANAQAQLVKVAQRAAALGVTLPPLPSGVRAGTRALLEARLLEAGSAKALALSDRLLRQALDESDPQSLNAARLVVEQTEQPHTQRRSIESATVQRFVLQVDQGKGQRTIDVGGAAAEPGQGDPEEAVRRSISPSSSASLGLIHARLDALERGQAELLALVRGLVSGGSGA